MLPVPGGLVPDGQQPLLSRGGPGAPGRGRCPCRRRHAGDQRRLRRVRGGHGARDRRRAVPVGRGDPRRRSGADGPRLAGLRAAAGPVPLDDWTRWWAWVPGADWRHPTGPDSDLEGMGDHPVVHVGFEDALAYAAWAGKRLATEAEWEHAARGGLDGATYAWGEQFRLGGVLQANTFHGDFPWRSADPLGFERTSPVGSFPANGFGLHDMIGNVWEWTSTPWSVESLAGQQGSRGSRAVRRPSHACCGPASVGAGSAGRARAARHEGRVAPVRAVVLSSLPAGRAAGARGAQHHEPPRLPLRP